MPAWIDFPGAAQVAQLRRTVTAGGTKTVEVVYLITSANRTAAPPQRLAAWVQGRAYPGAISTGEVRGECRTRGRGRR